MAQSISNFDAHLAEMATVYSSPSPTSTLDSDNGGSTSFVGNTPSTVLFFLAMLVGVAIAFVFIFFTMRYFVRSRYGLHIYPVAHHGMMFTANVGPDRVALSHSPSDRELDWYMAYLRNNHFFRDDFFERRYLSAVEGLDALGGSRRRRRRRRGRYLKMKKLTLAQVDRLFPKTSYAEWLHLGDAEDDLTLIQLNLEGENEKVSAAKTEQGDFEVIELRRLSSPEQTTHDIDATSLATSNIKAELHFDSGNCAICLDAYEPDDTVRGLICGHVFHDECVDPWLTRRRACCPICKRDYYKENNRDGNGDALVTEQPEGTVTTERSAPPEESRSEDPTQPQEVDLSETTNNNSQTEAANNTEDEITINYDILRNDPNLRNLLNELIPLSERANAILLGQETLDLELAARVVANKKFSNCCKRLFWRLMGISKEDMFNWAVISLYSDEQAQQHEEGRDDVSRDFPVLHLPHVEPTRENEDTVQMEQIAPTEANDENTAETRGSQESRRSVYHNAESSLEDLAEAAQEVVDRRV